MKLRVATVVVSVQLALFHWCTVAFYFEFFYKEWMRFGLQEMSTDTYLQISAQSAGQFARNLLLCGSTQFQIGWGGELPSVFRFCKHFHFLNVFHFGENYH